MFIRDLCRAKSVFIVDYDEDDGRGSKKLAGVRKLSLKTNSQVFEGYVADKGKIC